jgi:hypothetical protein
LLRGNIRIAGGINAAILQVFLAAEAGSIELIELFLSMFSCFFLLFLKNSLDFICGL